MSLLVQADELATLLRSPTPPVVFDATALLPGEGGNPAERFLHEHIAGSLYFDIDIFPTCRACSHTPCRPPRVMPA